MQTPPDDQANDQPTELSVEEATALAQKLYRYLLWGFIFPPLSLWAFFKAIKNKRQSEEWVQSHFLYQIRAYFRCQMLTAIGILMAVFGIGLLLIAFAWAWYAANCYWGLRLLRENRGHPNPGTKWI